MASQFSILWGELKKLTPMTKARDTNYEKDRKIIMGQLGMLGGDGSKGKKASTKSLVPRVQLNKHHGKKARAMEGSAHLDALRQDNKADSKKRLEVQSLVHEIEAKNDVSKELAKYVVAQKPIPPRLLKALVGGKMTRTNTLPPIEQKAKHVGYVPPPTNKIHVPRNVITMQKRCDNKWAAAEREFLIDLYREMDRPQGTQVGLWKIYYGRLSDRFRALYPHRCPEEISDKLHSMIEKRQMHATSEVEHWKKIGTHKAQDRDKGSPTKHI